MITESKIGVLILSPYYEPNIGGVENYLKDLTEYLNKLNLYNIFVLTYQPITTKTKGKYFEKKDNIDVIRLPWIGFNLFHKLEPYPILEFLYITWLFLCSIFFLLFKLNRIHVIHAQGLNAAFITKFLSKIFRKRSVMSTCAVYNFERRSFFSIIVKWTLSGFDKILPLADYSKKELINIGLPENKMKTYHLWINQNLYKPADKKLCKEKIDLENKFIVLFVGRFIKAKGIMELIEVAKQIQDNIFFVFIGDSGPLYNWVEKASVEIKNIILIKGIRGTQLIPYYQAADVLIVPSQYDEAFGKVIIEALACGTPVIGSNKGAIPYILNDSIGCVIEPTIENIKKEIEYLYNHPDILCCMTSKCRNYALDQFGEQNAAVIVDSYQLK